MKARFSRQYQAGLKAYLKQQSEARLQRAHGMGRQALAAGLNTLDIAKLHEQILVARVLPGIPAGRRVTLIRRAGLFFTEAITPIEKIHRTAHEGRPPPE